MISGKTHVTEAGPSMGSDLRHVSDRQNLLVIVPMPMRANAIGSLSVLCPLLSTEVRVLSEYQTGHTYELKKQGMTEKRLCLLLDQPGAMQEAVKREEIRERRCTIRQFLFMVLVWFRSTECHERELVSEYIDGKHKFASAAPLVPWLV